MVDCNLIDTRHLDFFSDIFHIHIILFFRLDPFANGGATPDVKSRGYSQIMREAGLKRDEVDLQNQMKERAKEGTLKVVDKNAGQAAPPKRRGR